MRSVILAAATSIVLLAGVGAAPAGAGVLPIEPPPTGPVTTPVATIPSPVDEPGTANARQAGTPESLVGTFALEAASCGGAVSGSYFRMIQPGGDASGPYVQNGDSSCDDTTYTPMAPGTDGGLVTGSYQAGPDPAFDTTGGGKAARITKPTKFFGVDFASATNPTDPQTGTKVVAPEVEHDGAGGLTGDLRAFGASWNNQQFNQGAPKPDGSTPGATSLPTGSFDPDTGAFVLEWTSQIVGGPFNGFTGLWHFEGTFESAGSAPAPSPDSSAPATSAPGSASLGSGSGSGSTSSSGASGSSSGFSSGGAATSTGSGAAADPLALTGPTFPAGPGVVLLAAGLTGLVLRRRLHGS